MATQETTKLSRERLYQARLALSRHDIACRKADDTYWAVIEATGPAQAELRAQAFVAWEIAQDHAMTRLFADIDLARVI